jgi:hypothetical protein
LPSGIAREIMLGMKIWKLISVLVMGCLSSTGVAQKLAVKVINRQDSDTNYHSFVPGHSQTNSNESASCNGDYNSVNCSGTSHSNTTSTAPHEVSYNVTGATLGLLLPDGRIAIVNCTSKYSPKFDYVNRRSCRIPPVDNIEADFKGKNAKLRWPVSLDGKKFDAETYQILTVTDRQQ